MAVYATRTIALNGSVKTIKYEDFQDGVDTVSVLLKRMVEVIPEDVLAESRDMGEIYKWYLFCLLYTSRCV